MYFHIFGTLYPIIIEISFCNLVAPVTNHLKMYTISLHYNTPRVLVGVRGAYRFSFLCCVFCFVCLRPVFCVPNVVIVSELSILNCHFGFLYYLHAVKNIIDMAYYNINC